MTELMKRYEAETGHNAFLTYGITQAICYPTYVEWLEEQLSNQTVEKFQEIIRNQCDEISALKAQLTWRPVTQRPRKEGWYLCKVHYVNDTIGEETVHFDGENFVFGNVSHWLPIPPAPEGEVKMLVDKNGKEITAGCKVMWGNTLCDIDWVGESHRKEVHDLCAKHMEVVDVDKEGECNIKIEGKVPIQPSTIEKWTDGDYGSGMVVNTSNISTEMESE